METVNENDLLSANRNLLRLNELELKLSRNRCKTISDGEQLRQVRREIEKEKSRLKQLLKTAKLRMF